MRRLLPACLALLPLWPAALSAQSLSVEDILAQVDKKVGAVSEYRDLLADPDPDRSQAAMQIMLGSGDLELQRMALDYGLYSPNPVVQRTALQAFFDSQPVLNMTFDPAGSKAPADFKYTLETSGGSVDAAGKGHVSYKVGEYDKDRSCWPYAGYNKCLVRLNDASVALLLWDKWWAARLTDGGELEASGPVPRVKDAAVRMTVPVAN